MTQNTKSFLYTISAVLLWSTAATAFKLTLKGMDNLQLLFYSSLASTIVLFIIVKVKHAKELHLLFEAKHFKNNILLGLLNPFFYYLVLFKAYSLIPAQEAMPLNYTWPIAIGIFSSIFLKHNLTLRTVIGMLVAFFGVIIIGTRGNILDFQFHNIYGVSLAFGSSIIWASYWTLNLIDKRPEALKLFASFVFGTVMIFVYVIFFGQLKVSNWTYLIGSTYIGLFEMGITFFLWMTGLQLSNNKAKTSTLAYLSPFISMIFISIVLGEDLLTSSIVGLVFIIGGIFIQQINTKTSET